MMWGIDDDGIGYLHILAPGVYQRHSARLGSYIHSCHTLFGNFQFMHLFAVRQVANCAIANYTISTYAYAK